MTVVYPLESLGEFHLATGKHAENGEGCHQEWVSRIAGEPWSDHPQCVSSVIGEFCRSWNDSIADQETRDRLLKPFLTKVIGTNTGRADERTRAWMCTDWLARVQAPAWLRLAGLTDDANALTALSEIKDAKSAKAAQRVLDQARANAVAAGAAAGVAAGAAAGAAARAAAGVAVRVAAGVAVWAAAGVAAGAAAGAAAGVAAGAVLAPTVVELQDSAVLLLDRLCAVGRVT